MIKIETVHIEELRGIKKLDLDLQKEKYSISGPNGSGKSGVIDAIEFGLTGQIGRLTGKGTKGLSVSEHGPHIDTIKFPDAAFIRLRVFLTDIKKTVTITRTVSAPKKPKIEPPDLDVLKVLAEVADHPEITLSRREILRFILVEPTKRSEEIQTILKLDEIGQTRNAFNSAANRLGESLKSAVSLAESNKNQLQIHLQIATLRPEDLLLAVNQRRKVLGLPEIGELTADTKLDAGISGSGKSTGFNKQSALNDLNALSNAIVGFPDLEKVAALAIVTDVEKLERDPSLIAALQRHDLLEKGLDLITEAACPFCDKEWDDIESLKAHIKAKLVKSAEASKLKQSLLKNGGTIAAAVTRIAVLLKPVHLHAENNEEKKFAQTLTNWTVELEGFKVALSSIEGIVAAKDRLEMGWTKQPEALAAQLATLKEKVELKPDQSAMIDAQTFLTTAQLRLGDYRESMRKKKAAEIAHATAQFAYDAYCSVMEGDLNRLYAEVEKDFSIYYRLINGDDEQKFTAKLTPSQGSLGLDVNFYERGLYPPAAYHSEGHQDGMGVCLYLALMKHLFGERFTFALLDDVVMSVDADHRYNFCKLLKTYFPDTQFVITTHDRTWAEQMKSAQLVTSKTSIRFHSWSIDTGPLVESNEDIWNEVAAFLAKGNVRSAAGALRHHLEYVAHHLADQLGADARYHADGNYDLGELMPKVLHRMKDLYGRAAAAAHSWGKQAEHQAIVERKKRLSECNGAVYVEQWPVNKAVHYNSWTNFEKKDFEPVVAAYKELLECFLCQSCKAWFYVTPSRGTEELVRCPCPDTNLNLKVKAACARERCPGTVPVTNLEITGFVGTEEIAAEPAVCPRISCVAAHAH